MSPADTTNAVVVEDAARRRRYDDRTCVRGHGNNSRGYHRVDGDDGDDGDGHGGDGDGDGDDDGDDDDDDDGHGDGDVALARLRLMRRDDDALRRRGRRGGEGRGGERVAGALIKADATDDYDCEDR